jgi:Tfp pilus assembly protein PilF
MYWLASTFIDDGQLEEAERVLDDILQIDPTHARVWFRRGEIRMIRGDYRGAIEAFETAKKKGVPRKYVAPKIHECERLLGKQ